MGRAGIVGRVTVAAGTEDMEQGLERASPPLPVGTRLVHIGPSKTGTTSLQAAMWAARDELRRQGVHYAGRSRHPGAAARAVVGMRSAYRETGSPPIEKWQTLVAEIAGAREPRVMLSSEFLAGAQPETARRIVADLGGERVHVVVTLRPLWKVLASRWSQDVQMGQSLSYDVFLDSLFNPPASASGAAMWLRHRHDELIDRWVEVVGRDRLTAVVVDDRDHARVLRDFERLLGLSQGTLEVQEDLANRSLTLAEAEALRAFNVAYRSAGLGRALRTHLVRLGMASTMKQRRPGAGEARIDTPQWALDRAGDVAREVVANIRASRVRVIGDLDLLTTAPSGGLEAGHAGAVDLPADIAASMSIGILIAGGFARRENEGTAGVQAAESRLRGRRRARGPGPSPIAARGQDDRPPGTELCEDALRGHAAPGGRDPPTAMTTSGGDEASVPEGTRLIHIGPSKTGTTSLQAAMWAGRDAMRRQGVRYAGRSRHSELAARAVARVRSPDASGGAPPPIGLWEDLAREIRAAHEPRLIFSSEFLAHAQTDAIRRLVDDLDPARVHVAVTLRPLARMLASQWQQNVQAGGTASFDAWLDALFNRPDGGRATKLWHRHRHDRLIARWAKVVGVDRVTVVVVDDRDHAQVLRAFETLLGLRPATLDLEASRANRSLTLAEVEALRAFNEACWTADVGRAQHNRLVRLGVTAQMKLRIARRRGGEDRHAAVGPRSRGRPVPRDRRRHRRLRGPADGRSGPVDRGADEPPPMRTRCGPSTSRHRSPRRSPWASSSRAGWPEWRAPAVSGRSGIDDPDVDLVPTRSVARVLYQRVDSATRNRYSEARRRLEAARGVDDDEPRRDGRHPCPTAHASCISGRTRREPRRSRPPCGRRAMQCSCRASGWPAARAIRSARPARSRASRRRTASGPRRCANGASSWATYGAQASPGSS